jgi:hypothetical protein
MVQVLLHEMTQLWEIYNDKDWLNEKYCLCKVCLGAKVPRKECKCKLCDICGIHINKGHMNEKSYKGLCHYCYDYRQRHPNA